MKRWFQVFEIQPLGNELLIVHRQENPPYTNRNTLTGLQAVRVKLFVIDDTTHSTMLLAEEY